MIFLPGMVGLASGLAVAGGMFALLIALGVIARFAGKTNTASWVLYYEDAAALGGIFGNLFSLYQFRIPVGITGAALFGLFSGIFTGTWAMALTEIVDAVPVFHQTDPSERRNSMAHSCHGSGTESGSMAACPFRLLNIRFWVKLSPLVVPVKAGGGILFIQTVQGFLPERG